VVAVRSELFRLGPYRLGGFGLEVCAFLVPGPDRTLTETRSPLCLSGYRSATRWHVGSSSSKRPALCVPWFLEACLDVSAAALGGGETGVLMEYPGFDGLIGRRHLW
jgi:hypothetical protein